MANYAFPNEKSEASLAGRGFVTAFAAVLAIFLGAGIAAAAVFIDVDQTTEGNKLIIKADVEINDKESLNIDSIKFNINGGNHSLTDCEVPFDRDGYDLQTITCGGQSLDVSLTKMAGSGWMILGYSTPLESEYSGDKENVTIAEDNSTKEVKTEFLQAIGDDKWGKLESGEYMGFWDGEYHLGDQPMDFMRNPLVVYYSAGSDLSVLPVGTQVSLPLLPSPWGDEDKVYNVTDTGPAITGNTIVIYTGEGLEAQQLSNEITGESMAVINGVENGSAKFKITINWNVPDEWLPDNFNTTVIVDAGGNQTSGNSNGTDVTNGTGNGTGGNGTGNQTGNETNNGTDNGTITPTPQGSSETEGLSTGRGGHRVNRTITKVNITPEGPIEEEKAKRQSKIDAERPVQMVNTTTEGPIELPEVPTTINQTQNRSNPLTGLFVLGSTSNWILWIVAAVLVAGGILYWKRKSIFNGKKAKNSKNFDGDYNGAPTTTITSDPDIGGVGGSLSQAPMVTTVHSTDAKETYPTVFQPLITTAEPLDTGSKLSMIAESVKSGTQEIKPIDQEIDITDISVEQLISQPIASETQFTETTPEAVSEPLDEDYENQKAPVMGIFGSTTNSTPTQLASDNRNANIVN